MANSAEEQIFAALDRTVGNITKLAMDPTEAATEASQHYSLNPHKIARLAEMANISLTNAHMRTALDKTASFSLVDTAEVMKKVFVDRVYEPSASPDQVPDVWGGNDFHQEVKLGSADLGWEKSTPSPRDLADLIEQARGTIQEVEAQMKEASMRMEDHTLKALSCFSKLAVYFNSSNTSYEFPEFEAEILSEYGDQALPVLDLIYKHAGLTCPRQDVTRCKRAAFQYEERSIHTLLAEGLRETDQRKEAERQARELASKVDQKRATIEALIRQVGGLEEEEPLKKKASLGVAEHLTGIYNPTSTGLGSWAKPQHAPFTKSWGDVLTKARTHSIKSQYEDNTDETDMEVENIKRQVILRDLMQHDDIIGKHHPQDIQRIYNTILQVSPNVTLMPEVMRSILRNATAQQSMDTFTAKNLGDLEQVHLKNEELRDKTPEDK